jgi:protein phosphatase
VPLLSCGWGAGYNPAGIRRPTWFAQAACLPRLFRITAMEDRKSTWDQGLECAVLSDIGLRRTNNQDSFATVVATNEAMWRKRGHLLVVADGMGAHAAGELASKLAVDNIPHLYHKLEDEPPREAIFHAIQRANEQIHERGSANIDFHGMGTTSSVLLLVPGGALVAHVGDSRVYRLRGQRLEQLTFDHSLQWEMMADSAFRGADIAGSVPKNIITRSLGPNPEVQIDLEGPLSVAVGDTFLLCSDGLSGQVKDDELGIILGCLPPKEAVRALVDLANLRGGPDNITVAVARVTGQHLATVDGAEPSQTVDTAPAAGGGRGGWLALLAALVLGLGAGAAMATQRGPLAIVLGAASLLLLGVGLLALQARRARGGSGGATGAAPGQPRRGPYVSLTVAPHAGFVEHLTNEYQQLRDAASNKDWDVDWSRVLDFGRKAAAAAEAKDLPTAVQNYCRAISFLMTELRSQQRRKKPPGRPDDSGL